MTNCSNKCSMRMYKPDLIAGVAVIVLSALLVAEGVMSYFGNELLSQPLFGPFVAVVLLVSAAGFLSSGRTSSYQVRNLKATDAGPSVKH